MTTSTSAVESVLARVRVHDVDTHVAEPDDLWTRRIGAKWGDRAPHVVMTDDQARLIVNGSMAVADYFVRNVIL